MLSLARRRGIWVVLCVVVVGGAAYAFAKREPKRYTATASLVFTNDQLNQQAAGLPVVSSGGSQAPQQQTNLRLVELGDMAERTAAKLGRGLTRAKVASDVSASAHGESNVVEVAASTSSPPLAAEVANTYSTLFVREQQKSNHAYYSSALKLVRKELAAMSPKQRRSAAGLALDDRAQSLGVLAELKGGDVEVAQAASTPSSPSSPKVAKDAVLGAVLGLLLGLGLASLIERLDQRVREPKDLEAIYGLPLLGVVPESKALSRLTRRNGDEANAALPPGEAEAFHLIRAHLRYFNVDRELRTLMIASAAPGDGKTTIARHLASAAARMGSRVLLLEADLRRPTLAQQLDIQTGLGLADVLIGAISVNQATRTIELSAPTGEGSSGRTLDVLTAGAALPPNPGELIESNAMLSLLEQARPTYDLVVIDTPPLTAVSDAFPLLSKVDGVVIVGRVGRNRRDVAERLHEILTGAEAPLLGVIANGYKARGGLGAYGYGSSYQYASAPASGKTAESTAGPPPDGSASMEEEPLSRPARVDA